MAKTKTPQRGQRAKTNKSGKKPVKKAQKVAVGFDRTITKKPKILS